MHFQLTSVTDTDTDNDNDSPMIAIFMTANGLTCNTAFDSSQFIDEKSCVETLTTAITMLAKCCYRKKKEGNDASF